MNLSKYPPNWAQIRRAVLERDGYKCQHCGVAHGELKSNEKGRPFKVFLQVAHLDHDKENNEVALARLLALCQPCHLANDTEHRERLLAEYVPPQRGAKPGKPQLKAHIKALEKELERAMNKVASVEYIEILVREDTKHKDEEIARLKEEVLFWKGKKR